MKPPITHPARLLPPPSTCPIRENSPPVVSVAGRQYYVSRHLFVRAVGLVFLLAFGSTLGQLPAILNPDGLWPDTWVRWQLAENFAGLAQEAPRSILSWLAPVPAVLTMLCAAGTVAGLSALLNILPRWSLLFCSLSYWTIVQIGGPFFQYQWDYLLLECGLLACLLAPRGASPGGRRHSPAPSSWGLVAVGRLLLARLLLGSVVAKFTMGTSSWAGLTGLLHHFETQPIPTRLAWWLAQCPPAVLKAGTGLVLGIELAGGLCVIGPRKARLAAAPVLMVWFLFLDLTGGHAFMNLLAAALTLLLIDDQAWARLRKAAWQPRSAPLPPAWRRLMQPWVAAAWAAMMAVSLGLQTLQAAVPRFAMTHSLRPLPLTPFYAMYPAVDTHRYELVIEGSLDGQHWLSYEFRDKPGRVHRPPPWWRPIHPRLDYQLWFAAHEPEASKRWVDRLLSALLRNDPAVLGLLEHNPFGLWPPRWVRATLYEYHFTTLEERRRTGNWWWRRPTAPYIPARRLAPKENPYLPDSKTTHA